MLQRLKKNYLLLVSTFLILYFFFNCQWMPIGMIEKRLKKDLSENLIAVDRQAKTFNKLV